MCVALQCLYRFCLFFLFFKYDQFYQGWSAEHSAEHTTKSFTGFWFFGRFAGHCSRWSRSSGQTLQEAQAVGQVSRRAREAQTARISNGVAYHPSGESLLSTQPNGQTPFSNSAALCFTETWLNGDIPACYICLIISWSEQIGTQNQRGKSHGGGTCFYINERWCTDVTVLKKMCSSDLETLFTNCKPFYSPREFYISSTTSARELSFTETRWSDQRHRTTTLRLCFNHSRGL